ncbi:hypothetical protein [Solibacillus sp. CAU 1738]|uniref:hypothetical protein n=1 Tax=Solibacillus sp. CAU 1738 TaxID=3140363 RepID=UPI00325FE428
MQLEIMQVEEINVIAVQHLIDEEMMLRIQKKRYDTLFLAYEKEQIVGVGIIWLNSFHPFAKYAAIGCEESENTTCIEDALFEKMRQSKGKYQRIIFSFWNTNTRMQAFSNHYKLSLLRKTFLPKLEVGELVTKLENIVTLQMDQILTLQEILNTPSLKNSFLQLLKTTYEETHLVNPTANQSIVEWESSLNDQEPLLDESLVHVQTRNGEQIVTAYILLHHEEVYEIGWIGGQDDYILKSILLNQLLRLHENGVSHIEAEIDTTDSYAMKLFKFLEIESKTYPTWLTYAYE